MTPLSCAHAVVGTDGAQFCAIHHDRTRIDDRYGHYFSLAASAGNVEIEMLTYANARYHDLRRFTFAQAQAAMGGGSSDRR